jgi:hypothetical protein
VFVHVGKALFLSGRNVQDIMAALREKNISISDREVEYLGKKFVVYLAVAHQESQERLRDVMRSRGGYILHLDGTCEGDSPHLFTGLDGLSEIVLDSVKLPSEKAELIIPFLRRIKKQYGPPIALVHDMGKGILNAVQTVFPRTPDFICHFHFLRDVGKDLLDQEYQQIRKLLKEHRIRAELRRQAKRLEPEIEKDKNAYQEFLSRMNQDPMSLALSPHLPAMVTYALIHWALHPVDQLGGYGFPFDRPHLLLAQRLKTMDAVLQQLMARSRQSPMENEWPLYRMWYNLQNVVQDKRMKALVTQLEEKVGVFDALRQALGLAPSGGKKGLNDEGEDEKMDTIEQRVKHFCRWIDTEKQPAENTDYGKMVKQLETYWKKLFADPIAVETTNGQTFIYPQRTNNILERFFRDLKRQGRKKSGLSSLKKMLTHILPSTPLARNLKNDEYMAIILNGCATLEERFAQIDSELVLKKMKQERANSRGLSSPLKKIVRKPDFPQKLENQFLSTVD